jgi:hypothetical protein
MNILPRLMLSTQSNVITLAGSGFTFRAALAGQARKEVVLILLVIDRSRYSNGIISLRRVDDPRWTTALYIPAALSCISWLRKWSIRFGDRRHSVSASLSSSRPTAWLAAVPFQPSSPFPYRTGGRSSRSLFLAALQSAPVDCSTFRRIVVASSCASQ